MTVNINKKIKNLILAEQKKYNGKFLENIKTDDYIDKLFQKAEILFHYYSNDIAGFIAFYCNDYISKTLYITSIIVDPAYRGKKIGYCLLKSVQEVAKARGFISCRLEVHVENQIAIRLYEKCGFKKEKSEKCSAYKVYMTCDLM